MTLPTGSAVVTPQGSFDLAQTMDFGFGQREAQAGEPIMRLGFVTDDQHHQVGVAVTQAPDGALRYVVSGDADLGPVVAQTSRILSVDVDATGWDALGRRDDLIGRLQRGAARPAPTAVPLRLRSALLGGALGATSGDADGRGASTALPSGTARWSQVAGTDVAVMPDTGPARRRHRLRRATPRSSCAGCARSRRRPSTVVSTPPRFKALPQAEAETLLRELDGIGPFYAELVTVRALGHTDVVPSAEPTLLAEAGRLMQGGVPFTAAEYAEAAQAWSPWRTWASVAIRAAGPRLQ